MGQNPTYPFSLSVHILSHVGLM